MTTDERLDEIDAKLRTLTSAVNVLTARQQPSALMRFFSQTPVIMTLCSAAISGTIVTTRLVFSVLGQAEQLAVARNTVIPNAWANFEVLAAAADQVCVMAGKPHGAVCHRVRLKSPEILQAESGIYSVILPHRGAP